MKTLLEIAEWLCGPALRSSVFEPLVADWQRELDGATGVARWWTIARGSSALLMTITVCLVTGGSAMPRLTLVKGSTVLLLSTALLVAIQIGVNWFQFKRDYPFEVRLWIALPMILPLAIPLAMLPMMMLIRGAGRLAGRGAAVLLCGAVVAAYVTAGWLTPRLQGDFRDELYEEMDRRTVAAEQAGQVFYPWTAARQAKPTTPEQRAAARAQWKKNPLYLEDQAERTRPQWGRSAILPAALALAMGALGWALGGLGRTRASHAAGWWAFTWIALVFLDGRFLYPGNPVSQIIGRPPYWMPLAVFATAALALSIASRRSQRV
jgi:hypothetical protein